MNLLVLSLWSWPAWICQLTCSGLDTIVTVLQTNIFQYIFLEKEVLNLHSNLSEVHSWESNQQLVITVSGNSLETVQCQAITWPNDDQFPDVIWCQHEPMRLWNINPFWFNGVTWWQICVNIGSGNGFLSDSYQHQAITWTNVDLSELLGCIHLRTIWLEMFMISKTKLCLKNKHFKSQTHLPGDNELK